jgi:hypothetical protein
MTYQSPGLSYVRTDSHSHRRVSLQTCIHVFGWESLSIELMLKFSPSQRLSAQQVLETEWMSK